MPKQTVAGSAGYSDMLLRGSAMELPLHTGGRPIAEPGGLICSMLGGIGGSSLSRAESVSVEDTQGQTAVPSLLPKHVEAPENPGERDAVKSAGTGYTQADPSSRNERECDDFVGFVVLRAAIHQKVLARKNGPPHPISGPPWA